MAYLILDDQKPYFNVTDGFLDDLRIRLGRNKGEPVWLEHFHSNTGFRVVRIMATTKVSMIYDRSFADRDQGGYDFASRDDVISWEPPTA